jgi:hypothetical protein
MFTSIEIRDIEPNICIEKNDEVEWIVFYRLRKQTGSDENMSAVSNPLFRRLSRGNSPLLGVLGEKLLYFIR